jgi:hypothetical protein
MTDYLGNLLARSFAPAERGVRPRMPSIFEPASPAVLSGRFLETAIEGDSSSETPHSDPRPTSPEKNSPTDSRNVDSVPTPPGRPAEHAIPPSLARRSIPIARASAEPATPEKPSLLPRAETAPISFGRPPIDTGSAAPHDAASNTPASNPVRPAVPAGEKKTVMSPSASPSAPPPPPVPDPARRDNRGPTAGPQRSAVVPSPPRSLDPPASNIADRRSRTEHAVAGVVPKQAVRTESRSEVPQVAAATPPTIQVTIGRVEVRATTSATPQRPKSKKEPEMSLEAYLARRAEGDFR